MRRLYILIFTLLLVSCDRDKDRIKYPATYVFDRFETGVINVYAGSTKLENQALSKKFADNTDDVFYQPDSFNLQGFDLATITFISENQALINEPDTTISTVVTRVDDKIYFETSDTIYLEDQEPDKRFEFNPFTLTGYIQFPSNNPPLPRHGFGYLWSIYAIEDGAAIRIPMISVLEKNGFSQAGGTLSGFSTVSDLNNMLNAEYIDTYSELNYGDRDTLVVQQNFIVFSPF